LKVNSGYGYRVEGPAFYTPNNLNNRIVANGTTEFSANNGSVHTNFVSS
jgi:hypothetical protein